LAEEVYQTICSIQQHKEYIERLFIAHRFSTLKGINIMKTLKEMRELKDNISQYEKWII
jgi:hypothetical protein